MIPVRDVVPPGTFLSNWLDYTHPLEFPDSFAVFSVLAAVSATINGRVMANEGYKPACRPALYVLLYGSSGTKKGSAMGEACKLIELGVPQTPLLPDDWTMEALIARLSRDSRENERCGGLCLQEEFSDLIGGPDYTMRNTKVLTKLWDQRKAALRETIARGEEEILNPYFVGLWSTSPGWFEMTDPRNLASGFLRRLLIVNEAAPKHWVPSPELDEDLLDGLVSIYRDRLRPGAFQASSMRLTADSRSLMNEWYVDFVKPLSERSDEKTKHFCSCMQEHMLRLATCINILEGRGAIQMEVQSVQLAVDLLTLLIPGTQRVYSSLVPTPYARLRAAILRVVGGMKGGLHPRKIDRMIVEELGVRSKEVLKARAEMVEDGTLKWEGSKIVMGD